MGDLALDDGPKKWPMVLTMHNDVVTDDKYAEGIIGPIGSGPYYLSIHGNDVKFEMEVDPIRYSTEAFMAAFPHENSLQGGVRLAAFAEQGREIMGEHEGNPAMIRDEETYTMDFHIEANFYSRALPTNPTGIPAIFEFYSPRGNRYVQFCVRKVRSNQHANNANATNAGNVGTPPPPPPQPQYPFHPPPPQQPFGTHFQGHQQPNFPQQPAPAPTPFAAPAPPPAPTAAPAPPPAPSAAPFGFGSTTFGFGSTTFGSPAPPPPVATVHAPAPATTTTTNQASNVTPKASNGQQQQQQQQQTWTDPNFSGGHGYASMPNNNQAQQQQYNQGQKQKTGAMNYVLNKLGVQTADNNSFTSSTKMPNSKFFAADGNANGTASTISSSSASASL